MRVTGHDILVPIHGIRLGHSLAAGVVELVATDRRVATSQLSVAQMQAGIGHRSLKGANAR